MGLTVALNSALTGLNVNQQSLTVLSQNIANANTAGYSRQSINQQAVYIDGNGVGVSVKDVSRSVDQYLISATQQQTAAVGQAKVGSDYNARIQLLIGQPGNNNSIDTYVNNFFGAFQALAQTPQDATLQQTAVNDGAALADQINTLAHGLQDLQYQADHDIHSAVDAANNDLQQLFQLNTSITNASALGNPIGGLQDQRDAVLKDLSQYIDVRTFSRQGGGVNVATATGVSLVDDNLHQLSYSSVNSPTIFSSNGPISPLTVTAVDSNLSPIGSPVTLIAGGYGAAGTSILSGGKISGLVAMRDQQLPAMMAQLDQLAHTVVDQVNAIHNTGTGYPGANVYTGTTLVNGSSFTQWSGNIRIAVLGSDGQPVPSPYSDQTGGMPALDLDLSTLDSGSGDGRPSTQAIIDEINQYYSTQQNKAQVGNLDNIRLVSDSAALPGVPGQFSFDFDLSNRSAQGSDFFITGMQVKDDQGVDITNLTSSVPSVALDPSNTYVATAGSSLVTVNTTAPHGLKDGDMVFLSTPTLSVPSTVGGITGAELGGYFIVSNVTSTSFQITAPENATTSATVGVAGQTALPPYASVAAGDDARTNTSAVIKTGLSNSLSQYYTISVAVAVKAADGTLSKSTLTYRVVNATNNTLNQRYPVTAVSGDGLLRPPSSTTPVLTATLVDANGNELPKINGKYITTQNGYLQIKANNSSYSVAIDSLDSQQLGLPDSQPIIPGTNRGFSYYFGLNNFFQPNTATPTGNALAGSALNMAVEDRLKNNPSLLSLGTLVPTASSSDPANPTYTYERNAGDNGIVQKLAALGSGAIGFSAAGGMGPSTSTFAGYAGSVIGVASTQAANATSLQTNAQNLLDGFTQRASMVSGVNLDTELANTVIYQNAYAASARVITVANSFFDALLQAFQ